MKRERCRYCGFDLANADDYETIPEGEGNHLCWLDYDRCNTSAEEAIDRLIAENAELREALEAIIKADDEAEGMMRKMGIPPEEEMDIFKNARKAIAKARGKSE